MPYLLPILLIFAAVTFVCAAFWCPLVTDCYKIRTNRLRDGDVLRVTLLSDLHSTAYGKGQERLIDEICRTEPDLLILSGDIFDDRRPDEPVRELFATLKKLCIPTYYVFGNHEFYTKNSSQIADIARLHGIHMLGRTLPQKYSQSYKSHELLHFGGRRIYIGGLCDPMAYDDDQTWERDARLEFKDVAGEDGLRLLISHRPEKSALYAQLGFDASLSGHAHGGQVRLPFLREGLVAPHQGIWQGVILPHVGFFPKCTGGMYKIERENGENLYHIVSRGASKFASMPRIFNPPQICSVLIIGVDEQNDENIEK